MILKHFSVSLSKTNFLKIKERFFCSKRFVPSSLYKQITPIGDPSLSVVPVLDKWVKDGKSVDEQTLRGIIYGLKIHKRFKHALEVSQWMTDKRYIPISSSDVAMRMNLIQRVHGLEQVEKHFASIPQQLKSFSVHLALLNCYSYAKSVDKADAIMQKAKELGYVSVPAWYNILMNLHFNTGNFEKIEHLIHEMEERGIRPDRFTLTARIKVYTALSDANGIDSIVRIMESDPQMILDWSLLAVVATGYLKVGSTDKALVMLEKTELLVKRGRRRDNAVRILIQLYAKAGKKDEVYRIWNQYKQNNKVYNNVYTSMMSALLTLEDFVGVESIFAEWESSSGFSYDFKVVNNLIDACCMVGDLEKAETVLKKGMLRGGNPNVVTWCNFAGGYIMGNKLQEAMDSLKKAISLCTLGSDPARLEMLKSCLGYLEGGQNVDEFIRSLNQKSVPSRGVLEKLFCFIKTGDLSSQSEDSNEDDVMTDDEVNIMRKQRPSESLE